MLDGVDHFLSAFEKLPAKFCPQEKHIPLISHEHHPHVFVDGKLDKEPTISVLSDFRFVVYSETCFAGLLCRLDQAIIMMQAIHLVIWVPPERGLSSFL